MQWSNIPTLFHDYVKATLSRYSRFQDISLAVLIGFDGATASQQTTVFTPPVDSDCLLFGAHVNFSNSNVTVKLTDTASGYVWTLSSSNAAGGFIPITAIAGVTTQNTPILPLVVPFLLNRQSKLQHDFINSASGLTAGGIITWRGAKLFA